MNVLGWKRKVGIGFAGLFLVLGAIAGWAYHAKPWAPAIEMVTPTSEGIRINENGLIGNYYPAKGEGRHPGILIFGGSEGGLGSEVTRHAKAMQAEGYSTFHLSFFRAPGQSPTLESIPLELFQSGLDWLRTRPGIDSARIGIMGWSRGTEAAQLIAMRNPDVKAVVLGMPSNAVWPGLDWNSPWNSLGSPWTHGDKPVPYIPADDVAFFRNPSSTDALRAIIKAQSKWPLAIIPIELINARVLLICGEDDSVWASCPMARLIEERARKTGSNVTLLAYASAGHLGYGAPVEKSNPAYGKLSFLGGTVDGANAALVDGLARTKSFLAETLKQ